MNVFSSKGPFPFIIIIISYLTLLSQSTEITKDNCKDNRKFLSQCSFHISFQPPLTEKLECFLTFPTMTNNSVRFSNDPFVLQRQIGQMCPQFHIEIKTQNDKPKRLFTTCGGTLNRVLKTFNNFTLGHILYDNKGLMDNSTTIKMQLRLETGKPCDDLNSKTFGVKNHRPWIIIILSAVGFVVLIIVCVVIVCVNHSKGNEETVSKTLLLEADYCESGEGGDGKCRDMEDDRKSQENIPLCASVEGANGKDLEDDSKRQELSETKEPVEV